MPERKTRIRNEEKQKIHPEDGISSLHEFRAKNDCICRSTKSITVFIYEDILTPFMCTCMRACPPLPPPTTSRKIGMDKTFRLFQT